MSLRDRLSRYADGVHRLREPAYVLDSSLPKGLAEIYREFDGGELFHEALSLLPSSKLSGAAVLEPATTSSGGPDPALRLRVGEVDSDELCIDRTSGVVWRLEKDTEEWLEEGSSIERWLLGWVDGQGVIFDHEGEFHDDVFDEDGELSATAVIRRERKLLKRDRAAIAPRWRLARALIADGKLSGARDELEKVVSERPAFAWAWYDLSRVSERLGSLESALEELREAATCDPLYPHAAFFWAHTARIYSLLGDEDGRRAATEKALAAAPEIVRVHRDATTDCLVEEDRESAREHLALALALAPRDIELLDMKRHLSNPAFDSET